MPKVYVTDSDRYRQYNLATINGGPNNPRIQGRRGRQRVGALPFDLYLCEANCVLTNFGNKEGRQSCIANCQAAQQQTGNPPNSSPPPAAESGTPAWLLPVGIGLVALKVLKII